MTQSATSLENIAIRRSEWVTTLLYLDGNQFSLEHFPFYRQIYDETYSALLLKTARQVAKSTTLANFLIMEACSTPHMKSLFVAPSQEQTTKFSQTRVGKTIFYSPDIRSRWVSKELSSRVYQKMFTNGSELAFSYASDDPDRVRGVSADRVAYDEVQDILYDEVIPVINECMANSDKAYETYCGTPKSMENTIEQLWQWSTQTEWVIRCSACNTYQFFVDERCIGKHGPICLKCGKYVNVRNGEWIDMNIYPAGHEGKRIKGFHIPQVILPKNVPASMPSDLKNQDVAEERWNRIKAKFNTYPPSKFRNEVMGVSDAIGTRLVSKDELEALCEPYEFGEQPSSNTIISGIKHIVAGIDWSGGGMNNTSRTVLWVWGIVGGTGMHAHKLRTLYFRIYPETNPISGGVIDHVCQICDSFGVQLIIGDAGEGALPNANLRERLGSHRAFQVQYRGTANATANSRPFYWNKVDRYMAERTTMIDNYMMYVKRQGVVFPSLRLMATPIKDILNEYEEVTNQGRKVWRHAPSQPDDCLHAQIFGWIAAKIAEGDPMFTYNGAA
jgi:hypothetical protein